ncbi:MAG: phosphonate ABC transporter, permease protein PhnE [Pseudomonadales bacterium]|jgi:phosphonate transport system permease protein|nr:phosphonate ABC transporter, permease protein PhnE [Pseudomonadales bacterium]
MATVLPASPDPIGLRYGPAKLRRAGVGALFGLLALALAAWQAEVDLPTLVRDLPAGLGKLTEFLPPDLSALPELLRPALVTLLLALVPLPIGVALAIPVAFAAAQNLSPPWLRWTARSYVTLQRNLPEIVLVLLLVRAFGLGAFPGIVAIALGSVGMLGKLLADAIEEIDPEKLDAIACTGAGPWHVIRFGVIPELMPALVASTLFRFEVNMRQAGLLGAVGAGGLGYELSYALNLLEYERVTTTFLVLLLLIALSERVSDALRRVLLSEGRSSA